MGPTFFSTLQYFYPQRQRKKKITLAVAIGNHQQTPPTGPFCFKIWSAIPLATEFTEERAILTEMIMRCSLAQIYDQENLRLFWSEGICGRNVYYFITVFELEFWKFL